MIMYTHTNWNYCLVQDDDAHWFLIPLERKKDWEDYIEYYREDSVPPHWAQPIDGPHNLMFSNPREIK